MTASLRILSLGAGVQSSVMALMAARGELYPTPDCAVFADTQWEPEGVYQHLDWLESELWFPVHRVTAGDIRADHVNGVNATGQNFTSMPLYSNGGGGRGRRQCTREYKLEPIRKKVRELAGLAKGQRAPKGFRAEMLIGISTDEAARMKPSRDKWIENRWPLVEAGMSRRDCIAWFERSYPGRTLSKSACIGCPFHNNAAWRDMKLNDPESWADAVDFDRSIRTKGAGYKSAEPQFVHRSCQPLEEVDFRNLEDMGQLNMFNNECEGMCGV